MDALLANSNEFKLTALARARFSSDLYPTELRILHDSVREGPAKAHSNEPPSGRHVRGEFLRWLLSDTTATALFDKDGLQVVSAIIDGDVDLDSTNILHDVRFDDCLFTESIHFLNAALRNLTIANSTVNGHVSTYGAQIYGGIDMLGTKLLFTGNGHTPYSLSLDEAAISGDVFLTDLSCAGRMSILNAKIGHLFADGATFESTLKMNGTSIGSLTLTNTKFTLRKTTADEFSLTDSAAVDLDGMIVSDSVYLSGATLQCEPVSLSMRNTTVTGNVYLTDHLRAFGKLAMSGVTVNQRLYVQESKLVELNADSAQIGSLFIILSELKRFESTGSHIGDFEWAGIINPHEASLNLARTHVKTFRDDRNSWPLPGNLQIIGLVYDDIELEVPLDRSIKSAASTDMGEPDNRIAWLHLQSKGDLLASQPWTQLAQYVRGSGNPAGAQKVLYNMRRIQAWNQGPLTGCKSLVPDYLDENPWRVTYFIGAFWGIGSLIFWRARRINAKAIAPKEKAAYEEFSGKGTLPPNVPPFNPVVYALENVLPVVKFGQDDAWGPNPAFRPAQRNGWRRWLPRYSYSWLALARLLLIILGWALAIILAGVIGGLFKS
jgi:hypothetical protein